MAKHRYTKPGKGEAFETALAIAANLSDEKLNRVGHQAYNTIRTQVAAAHPDLARGDVNEVAAKALRVERGNRRRIGGAKIQINVRLSAADLALLDHLTAEYGGQSQAMRLAIRHLYRVTFSE